MSNVKLETIQFHDQSLVVLNHNNKPYIAMKSIVENIGLDWHAQLNRINRHHVLSKGVVMIATPTKGGIQEIACLPLSMINGWLFGIETTRVKPEIRSTLEQYQLECFDVLYNHFMPKVAQQFPNTISIEQQQAIKRAVQERAYRTSEHYQAVYTKLYEAFKIPRYQDLPAAQFDNAMKFLGGVSSKNAIIDDNELYTRSRLLFVAEHMREQIQLIYPALKAIDSGFKEHFYSMAVEFRRDIEDARLLLNRETQHIELDRDHPRWHRILPIIRNKPNYPAIN